MNKEDEISYYQGYTTNKGVRRMKLTIITGPQGSGKTLLAKELIKDRIIIQPEMGFVKLENFEFTGTPNCVGLIDEYTGKEQIYQLLQINGFMVKPLCKKPFSVHYSEIIVCSNVDVLELLALEDFEITVIELNSFKRYTNYAEAIKPD